MKNRARPYFCAKLPIAGLIVATFAGALVQNGNAQVTVYDFFETGDFTQTTANPTFTQSDAQWYGAARIFVTSPGDAASALLTYPDGVTTSPLTQNGTTFSYQTSFVPTLAALDTQLQVAPALILTRFPVATSDLRAAP